MSKPDTVIGGQSITAINTGTCLSPEKINQLKETADKDDLFAIRDLDAYYGSCVGDQGNFLKYLKKKAEIGTASDIDSYAAYIEKHKSKQEAFLLYLKAAQMGDSYAKLKIARAYRDGDGVNKNLDQAFIWFQLGATCQEFGNNDMEELAEFLSQHKPVPLANAKALAWLNIVDNEIGLISYYKTMRDKIIGTLSESELNIAKQLTGEYLYDSGCTKIPK